MNVLGVSELGMVPSGLFFVGGADLFMLDRAVGMEAEDTGEILEPHDLHMSICCNGRDLWC